MTAGSFYARPEGYTDDDAIQLLKRTFELGITVLDTMDSKLYGNSEEVIGRAIKGLPRDRVVIVVKWGPKVNDDGSFGYDVNAAERIDITLKKLGVEYIDLWILRCNQHAASLQDEAMRGMKAAVEAGKVKYVGLSEASADQIRHAHSIHPITAIEMEWSLFTRDGERELVPACRELGIGFLAYSPLGRGILAGLDVSTLRKGDFRLHEERFQKETFSKNAALASKVKQLSDKKGCTPGQLALAWVLHQGDDVIPIPGTTKVKNLELNVAALDIPLSSQELKELEEAVPHAEVAGDRYPKGSGLMYTG